MESGATAQALISDEDALRAHYYRFLSRLLAAPPDDEVLTVVRGLGSDDSDLGRALGALARVGSTTTIAAAREEYHDLFIGLGRGELVPFGSYYLTGFLHEKPLANLRGDMARLGIGRSDGTHEPEDHIAALCEMMAGLIVGDFGSGGDLAEQREFFNAHVAPWAGRFFEDLERAESACFYMPVGTIGRTFMTIEGTAFEMVS